MLEQLSFVLALLFKNPSDFTVMGGNVEAGVTVDSSYVQSNPVEFAKDVKQVEFNVSEPLTLTSQELVGEEISAYVTGYTPESSCKLSGNNPLCLMANGQSVYVGAVACPYSLKFGDRVEIDGKMYTCADRYARWLDISRGLPTFDIFTYGIPYPKTLKSVKILRQ